MSATNRVIVGAAGATVIGLAGVAGAISYSHMAELARLHGEIGWRAHAFPVSVDGIEIVASLVLLAHRRAETRAGWLPWAALVAGTAASVAANVAIGGSDPVGRLVAGWPAVALLVSIKLMSGLLDAAPSGIAVNGSPPDGSAGPGSPGPGQSVPGAGTGAGPDRLKPVDRDGDRHHGTAGTAQSMDRSRTGTELAGLEAAARLVRDQLVAEGSPVNRRNLAAGLRAGGYRVRNDRLGHLLHVVVGEADTRSAPVDGAPASVPAGGAADA